MRVSKRVRAQLNNIFFGLLHGTHHGPRSCNYPGTSKADFCSPRVFRISWPLSLMGPTIEALTRDFSPAHRPLFSGFLGLRASVVWFALSVVAFMYGQFPFPFVICPMEFRNLLNSTLQISTTHPVSSNLTPSPLGSAWVRNHRGLKSAGLGQNSSVPLSEFSSRPFWDLHVIVRILSRPSWFPSGAGIWDASHFRFLDSRCKSRVGDGQEMTSFPVSDSDFPILGANPGSVKGRRLHHSRFRILISRFPVQNRPSPHGVSGEFISRFLIPLSIGT